MIIHSSDKLHLGRMMDLYANHKMGVNNKKPLPIGKKPTPLNILYGLDGTNFIYLKRHTPYIVVHDSSDLYYRAEVGIQSPGRWREIEEKRKTI